MCGAAALVAQAPSAEPENFLRKELAITTGELASLEKGQIIVRLPKTPETREVAAFAIMRLDVADGFFIVSESQIDGSTGLKPTREQIFHGFEYAQNGRLIIHGAAPPDESVGDST